MNESFPFLSLLVALLMLLGFVAPGFAWVSWFHFSDQFSWPGRLILGFVWSFAIFSLLGTPFLWFCGGTQEFLLVLHPAWAAFSLAGIVFYVAYRTSTHDVAGQPRSVNPPRDKLRAIPGPIGWQAWAILVVYALGVVFVSIVWTRFGDPTRAWIIQLIPILVIDGVLLAWGWRGQMGSVLLFDQEDEDSAPLLWWAMAVGLITLQAVSAVIYYRPDWDDCYYLAAVLDYEDARLLNDQEPTHREGFPVSAHQRLMCWELWGAVVCRYSGLNPMVVFHSVLPGLLVLMSYAAYFLLLSQFLPRRWVPLGLIGLWAYFLWGISGLTDPANHLLVRVWQGKAVLLHVVVPLTVVCLVLFARSLSVRWWLSLFACVCCGIGMSSSAIFMLGALTVCLALALLPTMQSGRAIFLIGCLLSLAPLVLTALAIKSAIGAEGSVLQSTQAISGLREWIGHLLSLTREGPAIIVWILCLPVLAVLLRDWRRQVYLVIFPTFLLATFANPLLTNVVTAQLTSNLAYYRLLWLFPVGVGLAVLLALLARLAGRICISQDGLRRDSAPLVICGAGVLVWSLLPGQYVWSTGNAFGGLFMAPRVANNLEKMPDDLLRMIRNLAQEPDLDKIRILCGSEVASFMTSYSRDFRFVYTRYNYTLHHLRLQARTQEAIERYSLSRLLVPPLNISNIDWRIFSDVLGAQAVDECRRSGFQLTEKDLPRLLEQYRVKYIITSPLIDIPSSKARTRWETDREEILEKSGYEVSLRGKEYVLWKRRGGLSSLPPGRQTQ